MPNMAIPREHRQQYYNSGTDTGSEIERAKEEGRKEGIRQAREQLGISQGGQTSSGSLSPLDRALQSIPCGPLPVPAHGTAHRGVVNNSLVENARQRAMEFESMKSAAQQLCRPDGEADDRGSGNAGSDTGASLLENARKRQQTAGQKGPLV